MLRSGLTFARRAAAAASRPAGPAAALLRLRCGLSGAARAFAAGVDLPEHTVLPMPALSPTMTEGTIASWTVAEGDEVNAGDAICDIVTDKATVAFETTDDGFIAKILVNAGTEDVPVGTAVAVLVEEADDVAAFADFQAAALDASGTPTTTVEAPPAPAPAAVAPAPVAAKAAPAAAHGRQPLIQFRHGNRASIAAQLAAEAARAAVAAVAAVAAPQAAAAVAPAVAAVAASAAADYTDIKASNMRKIIASRLAESKSEIPHFYVTQECDITELAALRKRLAAVTKVSVNDFVIRASALALRDVGVVNRSFDAVAGVAQPNGSVDISVAVATEGGLITPIVADADKKSIAQISTEVKELAGRAKAGALAPSEYQGGSFSISNLGMFGIGQFSAVINPPQGVIMAVGGGVAKLERDPETGGVRPRTKMTVKLSCDRRVVDEAQAAQLLQAFRHYMQTPERMLL